VAQLIGVFRLGRDAEIRHIQNGDAVASLSLVFNHGQKMQDGNKASQWLDASLWGKRAEAMAQYLKKGSQIYAVINDPHIETYQKREGGEGFKLTGKIGEIEFVGSKPGGGAPQPAARPAPARSAPSFDDLGNDDLPF